MSLLILGGVTVSVARSNVKETRELIGSISRSFAGTARYDIRAVKRKWTCKTTPMTSSAVASLLAVVEAASVPITMTGDLAGSVSVHARVTGSALAAARIGGAHFTNLRELDLEIWEV